MDRWIQPMSILEKRCCSWHTKTIWTGDAVTGHCCSDLAPLRQVRDSLSGPERQRHDRHGRLAAARRHQAAAVTDEEIRHVVRAVIDIDKRGLRILPHATGAEQVRRPTGDAD